MTILACLNFSGNVGKTTLSRHLLTPMLSGARRITIESINAGGEGADAEITSAAFTDLSVDLMTLDQDDHAVVDIGASNVESVMAQLKLMRSAESDFRYFVLPCTPDSKQQVDTIATATQLAELGVPSNRIHVVMNRVSDPSKIQTDFYPLIAAGDAFFTLVPVPIYESDAFGRLPADVSSIHAFANEVFDAKAMMAAEKDPAAKRAIAQRVVNQRLAKAASQNLLEVWNALNLDVAASA